MRSAKAIHARPTTARPAIRATAIRSICSSDSCQARLLTVPTVGGGCKDATNDSGHACKTNVVLTFLAVVVAAAATGGLGPGAIAAVAGFLAFDILFLPPYYTLVVSDRQDYLSLGVYLVTPLVVSYLVGALERRRIQAERREQETRTLYELSTSLVAHGSLDDTLSSVVRTVRSLFNLAGCAIVLPD